MSSWVWHPLHMAPCGHQTWGFNSLSMCLKQSDGQLCWDFLDISFATLLVLHIIVIHCQASYSFYKATCSDIEAFTLHFWLPASSLILDTDTNTFDTLVQHNRTSFRSEPYSSFPTEVWSAMNTGLLGCCNHVTEVLSNTKIFSAV